MRSFLEINDYFLSVADFGPSFEDGGGLCDVVEGIGEGEGEVEKEEPVGEGRPGAEEAHPSQETQVEVDFIPVANKRIAYQPVLGRFSDFENKLHILI